VIATVIYEVALRYVFHNRIIAKNIWVSTSLGLTPGGLRLFIKTIPALLAYRKNRLYMLTDTGYLTHEHFDFNKPMAISQAIQFLNKTGFLKLVTNQTIKSIPDYFIGLETGLDTNGRKNRSGKKMEKLIEVFIKDICARNGYEYMEQATAAKIMNKWGKKITVKKSSEKIVLY